MRSEAEYFPFVGPVPTRSHRQQRRVGAGNAAYIRPVPSVTTVPTANNEIDFEAIEPDISSFEERAAIAEYEGELFRDEAEAPARWKQDFAASAGLQLALVETWAARIARLANLRKLPPEAIQAVERAQAFIYEGRALEAARLGWDETALFGVCPKAPWDRLDRWGAAFGGPVEAVTRDAVAYTDGTRRYRATVNNDGGAVPIWTLFAGANDC